MLGRLVGVACLVLGLVLAGPAAAGPLLDVISTPPNINTIEELAAFNEFDTTDLVLDGEVLFTQLELPPGDDYTECEFGVDSWCSFDFGETLNIDYLVVKAGNYQALYSVTDNQVDVHVEEWGEFLYGPGGCLKNGGDKCFTPSISDARAISPIPEPDSIVLFLAGLTIVGVAIRKLAPEND